MNAKVWTIETITALGNRMRAGATTEQLAQHYNRKHHAMTALISRLRKAHPTLIPAAMDASYAGKLAHGVRTPPTPISEPGLAEIPENAAPLMTRTGCCWSVAGSGATMLFCNGPRVLPAQYCDAHLRAMFNHMPGKFRGKSRFQL